ncbi:MAG: hypothetical protein ACTHJ7_00180 [Candidatus Nitrosocosmicus sp.]
MASYFGIDPLTNLIHTTNTASNTISLIDGKNDENIVRINFQVNPENSGFIKCNGINDINQNNTIINIDTNNSCIAYPERGYTFNLWSGLILSEDNPVKFSAKEYGKIIANFKPTLSLDQYIFLIGGITGFISIILGWFFKGRQRRNFNKFIQIITEKLKDKEVLDKYKTIDEFEKIRQNLLNSYKKGSLTDFQFDYPDKKVINYIEKLNRIK